MPKFAGLLCLLLVFALPATAQEKRALSHEDYPRWKTTSDRALSADGSWAVWREAPDTVGDGRVVANRTDGDEEWIIPRGDDPKFTLDGRFVISRLLAPYDSVRSAKVDGKKGDDLPADSLVMLDLGDGSMETVGPIASFIVPDESRSLVAVLMKIESEESDDSDDSTGTEKPSALHQKKDGQRLELHRPSASRTLIGSVDYAMEYGFTKSGNWLVAALQSEDGRADGIVAMNTRTGAVDTLLSGSGHYAKLTFDDMSDRFAFVSDAAAFDAEAPAYSLYLGTVEDSITIVAGPESTGMPESWSVSQHANLAFSDSGSRLFFGTAPSPESETKDDRPDDEKVDVDIWHWQDPLLMTNQLMQVENEKKRSYRAVLHVDDGGMVQLATPQVPEINIVGHGDADVVFGISNMPYRQELSWDTPERQDVYGISVEDGRQTLILEGIQSDIYPSPNGSYLAWWDRNAVAWKITEWSADPRSIATRDVSSSVGVRFDNELHDWPYAPNAHGPAGWTAENEWFIVYDRNDLWAIQPNARSWSLTGGHGASRDLRYRYIETDDEAHFIDTTKPLLLSVFNRVDKSSGFARISLASGPDAGEPERESLTMAPFHHGPPLRAKDTDRYILTRETYNEFPDIWSVDEDFAAWNRLSDVNPQQAEYLWGSAELVNWTSTDGQRLEGILYKPEGFDQTRQYPMMVYFYERNSDALHRHHVPAPGRSVINRTFYASRGYLVFVPDIPYKIGYPGESAMNAVMPGVTTLIDRGFVDRERVGVQGHSWGGYQIAYMVTRTNLFRAAEAGAPVANMISAYGGIRWWTGLSRMFQYERTQSRIGGSLWDKPLRYLENSPIFWLDKVETPLLIMHNDADGHVPWYQGIELFVGLRRLGKPAWMINYNEEPHWPRPYWKRVDWTTRLQQYFDHYLMDAPAPRWMTEGVPATEKGRTMGLEIPADNR